MSAYPDQLYFHNPAQHLFPRYDKEVNYEVLVPIDYWRIGNYIVPYDAQARVHQLHDFLKLFQGDYSDYLNAYVKTNYHQITAMFVADILTSVPPVIEGADEYITPRFEQMLIKALHNVLVDMIRFGTGLFQVTAGDYGVEVHSPLPVTWYPATDNSDVLVNQLNDDEAELFISHENGDLEYRRVALKGTMIERELESDIVSVDEGWGAIQENTLGRVGSILNVARRPSTGDWGRSLYRDITSLAFEIVKRFSQNSDTITETQNPMLVLNPEPDAMPDDNLPDPNEADIDGTELALKFQTAKTRYDLWRKQPVVAVPNGYSSLEFISPDVDYEFAFMQIQEVEKQLFAATNIPAALYGLGIESTPPSGRALLVQNARTLIYTKQLQVEVIGGLKKMILVAAKLGGANDSAIQSLSDTMEIIWDNALELILEPAPVVMDDSAEVDDGNDEPDIVEQEEDIDVVQAE